VSSWCRENRRQDVAPGAEGVEEDGADSGIRAQLGHGEGELDRALAVTNAVIGINNRDLRTFDVSLAVTERLMDRLPSGRIVVSESGIWTRDDIALLEGLGVDAVLVGESLLRSPNVERATAELLSLSMRAELPLRVENGET